MRSDFLKYRQYSNKVMDVAVLILTEPIYDLFLGELVAFQLQLQDTGLQRVALGFQVFQARLGGFGDDAPPGVDTSCIQRFSS